MCHALTHSLSALNHPQLLLVDAPDLHVECLLQLRDLMPQVLLHLFHEPLPLLGLLSARLLLLHLLLADDYVSLIQPLILEELDVKEGLTLIYHNELVVLDQLRLVLHRGLINLTHNSDDEVHKDDVANDEDEEPEEPSEGLEVRGTLNDGGRVVIPDRLAQGDNIECKGANHASVNV